MLFEGADVDVSDSASLGRSGRSGAQMPGYNVHSATRIAFHNTTIVSQRDMDPKHASGFCASRCSLLLHPGSLL